MSNPASPKQSDRPPSQRSRNSQRSRRSDHLRDPDEASPLLANDADNRDYGDAPNLDESHSAAASSLRSLNEGYKKQRSWRWPSIIVLTILCLGVLAILGLGFAAPAVAEEYAKAAVTFKPTGLSVDSFTTTGVRARVQGDIVVDASRVHKKSVRDIGRAATWIARAVESKQSIIEVFIPKYQTLVGTAVIPPMVVGIRDGTTTHVDFIADLTAGDLDKLKAVATTWMRGKIDSLNVVARARIPLKSGIFPIGTQHVSESIVFGGRSFGLVHKSFTNWTCSKRITRTASV